MIASAAEVSPTDSESSPLQRPEGRLNNQLRPVTVQRRYTRHAAGSVLISMGNTRVLVTACVEERVPHHVKAQGSTHGWITAEYSMLPGATDTRSNRERLKVSGRTQEIQRLIGRSLRASVDLSILGQRTITIDADVLQADAGTRVAAITGGYIALYDALCHIQAKEMAKTPEMPLWPLPVISPVAAVGVGVVDGAVLLDMDYSEDSRAEVDANVVMNANGDLIEVQASSEGKPYTFEALQEMLVVARQGCEELLALQQQVLSQELPQ